jgi:HD-GYP domain-containing protein (c-di-GMP phosphodiesterase class II)
MPLTGRDAEVRHLEQKIRDVTLSTLCALVQLLDLKDLTTGVHSSRMVEWAITISKLLGLSPEETHEVEIAAVLHDIGKIGVPDEILKKPGRLTEDEIAVMRKHPEYGWAVMKNIPGCETTSLLVLHHHEAWDGSGYPAGLRSESIPLGSRVVAITDAFDAMTSDRCYRGALPVTEALSRLEKFSGRQFDPEMVAVFATYIRSEGVTPLSLRSS